MVLKVWTLRINSWFKKREKYRVKTFQDYIIRLQIEYSRLLNRRSNRDYSLSQLASFIIKSTSQEIHRYKLFSTYTKTFDGWEFWLAWLPYYHLPYYNSEEILKSFLRIFTKSLDFSRYSWLQKNSTNFPGFPSLVTSL